MHVPGTAQRPELAVKISTPASPFQASDISGGVAAAPLSQSQTRCAPRSTLELPKALFVSGTKRGFWLGSTQRESERGGEEDLRRKSQNISSKRLSSCAIIFCSLVFFSLSLANKLPGKAQDSPINNEKGRRGVKKIQQLARV